MLGNSPENTPFHELHFLLRVLRRMSKGMMESQSCSLQKICPPFWSPSVRLRLLLSKLWRLERRRVNTTGKASSFYFRYWLADLWGIRLSNTLTPAKWFPDKKAVLFYHLQIPPWILTNQFFFLGFYLVYGSREVRWQKQPFVERYLTLTLCHSGGVHKSYRVLSLFLFCFLGDIEIYWYFFFCLSLHILG